MSRLRQRMLGAALALALVSMLSSPALAGSAQERRPVSLDEFLRQVVAQHPIIRQARLGVAQANEERRVARGGFDPSLSAGWDRKTFGSVTYYDYATAALTVPTPYGADIKLGFERADGVYRNPDRRTPAAGLLTFGLSVPLGQRVLTDERRTAVAVARALRDGAVADRDGTVNRTLLQATRDYARWYDASRRSAIAREGVRLALFRVDAVRRRVANGDAAALDTTEALLEFHRRRAAAIEADQAMLAARLTAEVHVWDARGLPAALPTGAVPLADPDEGEVSSLVAAAASATSNAHPDVVRAESRVVQARALERLAMQQRLPALSSDIVSLRSAEESSGSRSGNDLKLGVSLRTPLLLLRERGRANGAALRSEQALIDRARVQREVNVQVRIAAADALAVREASELQRAAVAEARTLVRGEQLRLDAGESTLFLVNARERMLLEEEVRLAGLEARSLVVRAELQVALGAPWFGAPER